MAENSTGVVFTDTKHFGNYAWIICQAHWDSNSPTIEPCLVCEHARLSALVQGMALLWQQIEWAGDNDGFTCCVFCGALNGSTLAHHSDCEWVKMQAEFTRVKIEGAP